LSGESGGPTLKNHRSICASHPRRGLKLSGTALLFCSLINVVACLAIAGTARAQTDQLVCTDSLVNGWQNWSWATVNFSNTSPVQSGIDSIAVNAGPWQALYLHQTAF